LAKLQELATKNNGLALQANSKGKEKATKPSRYDDLSSDEDDELDDEEMTFFIKNFKMVMKKTNFRNFGKNKSKYEPRRSSSKNCFGCKKIGHFIADCPEEKKKNKDTKESSFKRHKPRHRKYSDEAHLGQEWVSNEESDSEDQDVATMPLKTTYSHSTSLFEDLTDDEDQGPTMCLMAKGLKVISPSSSDNEIDEEDEVAIIVKQYGKKGATRIMKLMMKLEELDESLESQEELLRIEKEKSEALEMNLTNESKENKKLWDSLKTKDSILLEVEEALPSEKEKWMN
jgi:hypothetical protein